MPLRLLPPDPGSSPEAAAPGQPAPAAPAPDNSAAPMPAEAAAFRVGEFEVGDGSCSELCGHPDILY